jgi:hypothetical protein
MTVLCITLIRLITWEEVVHVHLMTFCLNRNNVELAAVPPFTGFLCLLDRGLPDNIEEM